MLVLLSSLALAADCPPGQAPLGDGCFVLEAEVIAGVPWEVWKASHAAITTSVEVKRCLVPLAGAGARVEVVAEVSHGRATGVVVSAPRRIPLEVQACLATQVSLLALPPEPVEFRVAVPLLLLADR